MCVCVCVYFGSRAVDAGGVASELRKIHKASRWQPHWQRLGTMQCNP